MGKSRQNRWAGNSTGLNKWSPLLSVTWLFYACLFEAQVLLDNVRPVMLYCVSVLAFVQVHKSPAYRRVSVFGRGSW